ncbi:hypothetical protein M9Y10_027312 [Tritrichomonas musculus]|uniref:Uncharacterized protein n=1 Tax=Tritrichomonas musculus TaxID=1915356 RepID=A0ABR2H6A5_9EUKA
MTSKNSEEDLQSTDLPSQNNSAANGELELENKYKNEDYEEAIKQMLNKRKPPPKDMIEEIREYILKMTRISVQRQRYNSANRYEQSKNLLTQLTDPCSGYYQDKTKRETAFRQYEQTKKQLEEVTKQWHHTILNAKQVSKQRVESLKKTHEDEIEKFQKDWESPEYLAPFNKPSAELLKLRDVEKIYGLNKEFEKAKEAHRQAQKMEVIEVQQQREKAMNTMKSQFDQLLERQKKEIRVLIMKEQQIIDNLKVQMQKDQLPYKIKIAKYENEHKNKQRIKPIEEYIAEKPSRPLKSRENIHTEKTYQMLPIGSLNVRGYVRGKLKSQQKQEQQNSP